MSDAENLDDVRNIWLILNGVLILYGLILFCYSKFIKNKDTLHYVIHIINNIFFQIQKSIGNDTKGMFKRPEDSINISINKNIIEDDKKDPLI